MVESLLEALTHPSSLLHVTQLRSFNAHVRISQSFSTQDTLMGLFADSLEHMALTINYWPGSLVPFKISAFINLRLLDLCLVSHDSVTLVPWLHQLLDSIPEQNIIAHIRFEIPASDFDEELDELIDSSLTHAKFTQELRSCTIFIHNSSAESFQWNLPRLTFCGILSVKQGIMPVLIRQETPRDDAELELSAIRHLFAFRHL